jgi:Tol biopolymer transport system component
LYRGFSANGLAIWLLPLVGDRKPRPLLETPHNAGTAVLSPDGRWIAYDSDESGQWEVYVQPYPGLAEKWQVSTGGGNVPIWTRNGGELVYITAAEKVMAVAVTDQPRFHTGNPTLLFEAKSTHSDATPDGQRFFFIRQGEAESGPAHLNVVLSLFDELERSVPHGAH